MVFTAKRPLVSKYLPIQRGSPEEGHDDGKEAAIHIFCVAMARTGGGVCSGLLEYNTVPPTQTLNPELPGLQTTTLSQRLTN